MKDSIIHPKIEEITRSKTILVLKVKLRGLY